MRSCGRHTLASCGLLNNFPGFLMKIAKSTGRSTSVIEESALSESLISVLEQGGITQDIMATHTSHYCEVCELSFRLEHDLTKHMHSRRHQARAARTCTLCKITTRKKADMDSHLRGKKHKNKVLLRDISAATFDNMEELYRRALDILGRAVDTNLPALDLANCHPSAITNRLKKLEIGHACISCFSEFDSETLVKEHLHMDETHIYPKWLLEEEKERVLMLMANDPEGALKVKVVFALKKALLVHVFL
jgi:hypothetical protein